MPIKIECLSAATVANGCQSCPGVQSSQFSGLAITFDGGVTKYIDSGFSATFRGMDATLRDINGEVVLVKFQDSTFASFVDFKNTILGCGSAASGNIGISFPKGANEYNSDALAGDDGVAIGQFYVAGANHAESAQGTAKKRIA